MREHCGYDLLYGPFIFKFNLAEPYDFNGISTMLLLFDQSTQSVSVNISIADDMFFERTEIFQAYLTLVGPFNPTIITVRPSLANISIEDDDSKSTLTHQYAIVWATIVMKAAQFLHSCYHWV